MSFKKPFGRATLLCFLQVWSAFAASNPSPLPRSNPETEGLSAPRLERMHAYVSKFVTEGQHAGAVALVARHGKIVDWQTWGKANLETGAPMTRDSIFRIYSMSKVVTSVAALQLYERGLVRLDSPVTNWIPEFRNLKVFSGGTAQNPELSPATNGLTVRMLLNHTGGFTYDFFSGSPVHDLYKQQDLWNSHSLDEFIGKVAQLPLLAQPGAEFNYSIGDDILGALIQRVSGMPFEEYVAKNITEPLQMPDTGFSVAPENRGRLATIHEHGPDGKLRPAAAILGAYAEKGRGIPSGGGGLFSTIGDYARFAQCLLNGGQLDGQTILGRKTIELGLRNSLPPGVFAFSPSEGWGLFSAVRLDMAASLEPASEGMFYWSGAATTHFFADPKEDLLGLVFCQHIPFDEHHLFGGFHITVYQALQ